MTFTEAAVEVLRRVGKPLHYKEIAEAAVRDNMLSHVGQDPETTMGQRLAMMARREEERRVVAISPEGTFALTEWSVPAELVVEAKPPPEPEADPDKLYRSREREPRPIHTQARRRMEAIAAGEDPAEAERRDAKERDREREKERAEREPRGERTGGKRPLVAAEAAFEWLALRQSGAPLAELAAGLAANGSITEALSRDLPSLTAALLEDNRRRTEAGRKPAFIVDGERATLVEFPSPAQLAELERSPQTPQGRPASGTSIAHESKRACVRALRARLADLETAGFEHVCGALLEKMGMRDVRVAKRSKDGPLYLARHRWGVSDLRVAVRLVRGRREISRQDVLELRKDLAHYSSQMALLFAPGECGREARSEASAAAQPPVALYAGEALAEELLTQRVGVTVQVVEIADVDEAFFANARAQKTGRDGRPQREEGREGTYTGEAEASPTAAPQAPVAASSYASEEQKSESQGSTEGSAARAPEVEEKRGGEEPRDGRRRPPRREREERPRMASPADQAWGQPAGTPKKGALGLSETPPAPRPAEGQGTTSAEGASAAPSAPAGSNDSAAPSSDASVSGAGAPSAEASATPAATPGSEGQAEQSSSGASNPLSEPQPG